MSDIITDIIFQQIMNIRDSGLYNLLDIVGVQREAFERGYHELVILLNEHKKEYVEFIIYGKR